MEHYFEPLSRISLIQVRNSAVRTLFQTLGSHGQKLSKNMWEDCLWNYVFPMLNRASHKVNNSFLFSKLCMDVFSIYVVFYQAATSSKDEWRGKELGTRDGKTVHMLIHHR